jgi:hypothetical protein
MLPLILEPLVLYVLFINLEIKVSKTIILLVGLFGLETWSVTLRDKMYHEELHNLYSLPVIRVSKSRRVRWLVHIACIVETRNAYIIYLEILKVRDHLEDISIDGMINIKLDLEEWL